MNTFFLREVGHERGVSVSRAGGVAEGPTAVFCNEMGKQLHKVQGPPRQAWA